MTVFLPCRSGSLRVPEKNTKVFANIDGGLLKIKLNQLINTKRVSKIILSTDDSKAFDIAKKLNSKKVVLDNRPKKLATSSTSTDDVITYVGSIIKEDHVLWTHVTSPFLTSKKYDDIINTYYEKLEKGFDSLMTVNKLQTFLWNDKGSLNYDRKLEKWPRTQTLPKIYEVNSGVFINSIKNYKCFNDRIGEKPFLFETNGYESFDIDWEEDFLLAELIYKSLML